MYLRVVSSSQNDKPDLLRIRIGDALREERLKQTRTLQELADQANISISHLSDIERGRKEASSEVLRSLHHSLGLELDDLLQRTLGSSTPQLAVAA